MLKINTPDSSTSQSKFNRSEGPKLGGESKTCLRCIAVTLTNYGTSSACQFRKLPVLSINVNQYSISDEFSQLQRHASLFIASWDTKEWLVSKSFWDSKQARVPWHGNWTHQVTKRTCVAATRAGNPPTELAMIWHGSWITSSINASSWSTQANVWSLYNR